VSGPLGLADKVVVCTGAGSGIGRAAVEAFVAAGARVGVLEWDAAKCQALAKLGDSVFALHGDAGEAGTNRRLVEQALERWGGVDVAVTFVGVFDMYTPLTEIPDDRFDALYDEVLTVNLKSPLLTARAALGALRERHGSLILTCSSSSFYAGRGGPLYVASKFGLRGVVTALAHEMAPDVRVNGVAPGGTVGTDLAGPRSLGRSGERLDDRPGRAEALEARTPLHLALTPADHAGAYVFLASDAAAGITGEIIRSDGGLGVR
jgi:NAD(P)-dependent dehydrogenase (short-subunit alcohol dehydrogenase family)